MVERTETLAELAAQVAQTGRELGEVVAFGQATLDAIGSLVGCEETLASTGMNSFASVSESAVTMTTSSYGEIQVVVRRVTRDDQRIDLEASDFEDELVAEALHGQH